MYLGYFLSMMSPVINNVIFRKDESRSYPDHLPKTLPYLLQFVMTYATWLLKLETGLSICGHSCIQQNIVTAAKKVQELRDQLHWLQQRTAQVQHLLNSLSAYIPSHSPTQVGSVSDVPDTPASGIHHSNGHPDPSTLLSRLSLLQHYHTSLSRRQKMTHLQLGTARTLYRSLLKSKGHYIEQHKLLSILQYYHTRQASINHKHLQPSNHQDYADIPEYFMHDEL